MPKPSESLNEAVLFLKDHQVRNQMRLSEFDALLDGVVTLSDWADEEVNAVYVQVNKQLAIRAMVFFKIYFDEDGRADSEWNLPLQRLAKISGAGPDLGAGPVRLATRGQCAISWHQKDLWDPSMEPNRNDIQQIARAIKANRIGFKVEAPGQAIVAPRSGPGGAEEEVDENDIPVLDNEVEDEIVTPVLNDDAARIRTARLIKSQRLRIRTLVSQHEAETQELMRQHRLEMQAYRGQLREADQAIARYKVLNEQLKDKLERRSTQYEALQTEVAQYKKRFSMIEKELSSTLSAAEADRLKSRMEGELSILKEQLDRREAELFYRDEREEQLKTEIASLKDHLQAVEKSEIVQKLASLDVVFVVYHPGAGHITLPANEVKQYADNPMAYVAQRCFVTEEQYRAWLEHYENPVCTHLGSDGELCGKTVTRIAVPSDFETGDHDRCEEHKSV